MTNGVYVVIADPRTQRLLLLHRKLHWQGWEFVKGWRESNEDPQETARREVLEETGITVTSLIDLQTTLTFQTHEITREFESFLACSPEQPIHPGEEHDDARWVKFQEARILLTHTNTFPMLDAALHKLSLL